MAEARVLCEAYTVRDFKKSLTHSNSVFACQPHLQHLVFTISSFVDFIVDMRCSCK